LFAPLVVLATAVMGGGVGALVGSTIASYESDRGINALVGGLGTAAFIVYLGAFGLVVYRRQQRRAWYDRVVVLQAHVELSRAESEVTNEELDLPSLWSLTQKRLDYYHSLATSQAEKSFNYGLLAAGIGF
jgi:hypothetical protein